MQGNSRFHNYSSLIWPFKSVKCGKEQKKLQKIKYFRDKKSFSDEIKRI